MKKFALLAICTSAALFTTAEAQVSSIRPPAAKSSTSAIKGVDNDHLSTVPAGGTSSPLVGGSDSCSTPDAIAGSGPFGFNNTAATTGTQGQAEAACNFFGQMGITNDVWFDWTAGSTGLATVSLCGGATIDSKVAVYAGTGCPVGSAIACNDDSCGLQSQLTFSATSGIHYTIQLGNFPGATPGSGTFTINVSGPVLNDDCSTPIAIAGPGPFPFDNTSATTGSQGQTNSACNFFGTMGITHDVWFTWTSNVTGAVSLTLVGDTTIDSKVAVYDGSGCPLMAPLGCNDDSCGTLQSTVPFNAVLGNLYTIQLGTFPGATGGSGTFTIMQASTPAGCQYDDGTTENSIGLTAGGELMWLHRFGTLGDASTLSSVSTAWGSAAFPGGTPPNGTAAKIAVYEDPNDDGNPTDGVLLTLVATTVQNVDTDILNVVPLGTTLTVNGYYFVTASIVHASGQFPGPLDQSGCSSSPVAWVAGSTTGPFNYNNLGANNVPPAELGAIGLPGVWLLRADCSAGPAVAFCAGDGIDPNVTTPCPCGNFGAPGHGCANSTNPSGALLVASGTTGPDNVSLTGSGMPASVLTIFFKGDVNLSAGIVFGDGVRCVDGNLIRLGQGMNISGSSSYPNPGAPDPVSVRGQTPPGSGMTGFYQAYYRNALASFCPSRVFNITNGVQITW